MGTGGPFDPRRRERRLGLDRRWSRETREPDRRLGPGDRRQVFRRGDAPQSWLMRLLRRWFWPHGSRRRR